MIVLGIDTSTDVLGVALVAEDETRFSSSTRGRYIHSERLFPAIDSALERAGVAKGDVDLLAVAVGPGSFTGIRIGMAAAKALAYALQIPVVGVSTADVLAQPLGDEGWACPVITARRGEVYWRLYRDGRAVGDHRAGPEEELLASLAGRGPVVFTGDRAAEPAFRRAARARLGEDASFVEPSLCHPQATALCRLGLEAYRRGEPSDPLSLRPVYVRRSQAEVLWEARRRG